MFGFGAGLVLSLRVDVWVEFDFGLEFGLFWVRFGFILLFFGMRLCLGLCLDLRVWIGFKFLVWDVWVWLCV